MLVIDCGFKAMKRRHPQRVQFLAYYALCLSDHFIFVVMDREESPRERVGLA